MKAQEVAKQEVTARCTHCLKRFKADDGWQEFCSIHCAIRRVCAFIPKRGKSAIELYKESLRVFKGWWAKEDNKRSVRRVMREEESPKVGNYKKQVYEYKTRGGDVKRITVVRNVGGDIKVKPFTKRDKEFVRQRRGREGFSEGMSLGYNTMYPSEFVRQSGIIPRWMDAQENFERDL